MLDIQTTPQAKVTNNPFLKVKARHLVVCFILINVISSIALIGIFNLIGISNTDPLFTYLFYSSTFILTCFWLLKRLRNFNVTLSDLLKTPPQGYRWSKLFGLVFILMLSSLGWALLYLDCLSFITPSLYENVTSSLEAQSSAESFFPVIYNIVKGFALVVVAPITEELIFRGFLLNRWATKWNIHLGIILSSVLFGFLHVSPIGLSIVGIILSLLYIKTKTLIVPIVAHAMNNGIAAGLMFLETSTTSDINSGLSLNDIVSNGNISLWLIVISAPFMILFIYKNWPTNKTPLPYNLIGKAD